MIKIGLVGTGYINRVHARAAKDLNNVKVNAVFSRDKKRAESFAGELNISNYFDNYSAMLSSDKVDAVIIGVPTLYHKEYALKAFEASKHVLCEKPIALSLEGGKEMLEKSGKAGVIFMIAQVLRFWDEYSAVKELIERQTLGEIKSISAFRFSSVPEWSNNNWLLDPKQSGGVPVDLQIHDVDFIQWLLGKPDTIYSSGTFEKKLIINSKAVFSFKNSAAVTEAGYILPKGARFEAGFKIITDDAVIDFYNLREPALLMRRGNNYMEAVQTSHSSAYSNQLSYFADCIITKKIPERIKTSEAIEALSLSLKIKSMIESSNS